MRQSQRRSLAAQRNQAMAVRVPRRDSRSLTLKQLALRVVRNLDKEAAQVLGDAILERYGSKRPYRFGGLETGRTRPILFDVGVTYRPPPDKRMFTTTEAYWLSRFLVGHDRPRPIFEVKGRETVYNLTQYASSPTEDNWRRIFVMWVTSRPDTYRAMVRTGTIPRSIRYRDLVWEQRSGANLAYDLYLQRVPRGLKRPRRHYLFSIRREDDDADYLGEPKGERST